MSYCIVSTVTLNPTNQFDLGNLFHPNLQYVSQTFIKQEKPALSWQQICRKSIR